MQPAKYKLQQAEECAPLPRTDRQAFGAPTSCAAVVSELAGWGARVRTIGASDLRGDSRIEQQQATRKQLPSSVTRSE
ncbi:hypothetical protein SNOG_05582 [Parastagonospora nodorum SN15]|uniref:Uncharacterized protein n=1 Tax=Phaeosphaeria nodorum (strain SN15 / ATCC MYA-4574 / FGSC 10173) TaxID=321614 RepID=Q0URN2_PHANO|nr:hypothetical protein SNOG_05582 [Parastagonospora nodorum SN15]EAT86646.1 hypothetical protein SNOG_05582 [Parastagonospora nodorum SN15]